jgi:tripartite-type tricarboxylate transporter receptor subunit TctC
MNRRDLLKAALTLLAPAALTSTMGSAARAQAFPTRPIIVIVPSGPGGMDTTVRLIAPTLEKILGQPIIVENKPGANGMIAVQALKLAKPDGHTLMLATASILAVNPFIFKDVRYDSQADFEPVARHVMVPLVWAANPARGFKSLSDVVAHARANPGRVTMGFPGVGSFPYLIEEAFNRKHGINALLVPFRSAPEADMGAVAGTVDLTVDNVSTIVPLVRAGSLTGLAVTTQERVSSLPDVPSWMEDGTGPFPATGWFAFLAPKGTDPAVITKLNAAINEAVQSEPARERFAIQGAQFAPLSTAGLREFMASEIDKYHHIVQEVGIPLQ